MIDRVYEHPMEVEEHGAMPLAGGILQQGYQCGMLWGASLGAGAQAHRLFGGGPRAESAAILVAGRLLESFVERNESANCLEITDTDWKIKTQALLNFLKGGPIICLNMAGKYSPVAFGQIEAALAEEEFEAPEPPVSCAAEMARRMGASEMQATMAAGFAGGIGLSGGGCGALGAAVWIDGMRSLGETGFEKKAYAEINDTGAHGVLERFQKATDFTFECEKIVGRKFESVADHAEYVKGGGCRELIEDLAG